MSKTINLTIDDKEDEKKGVGFFRWIGRIILAVPLLVIAATMLVGAVEGLQHEGSQGAIGDALLGLGIAVVELLILIIEVLGLG